MNLRNENLFPNLNVDMSGIDNRYSRMKTLIQLREKLCIKITRRELDTDYIITCFERKSFGNEKFFEKRINLRNRNIYNINRFELDPTGNFLYLSMQIQDTVLDLVFYVLAVNKDPLVIKNGSEYIGFYDKYFYAMKRVTIEY